MTLKLQSLNINLPFGLGGANIVVTEAQKNVAWALYVELATRVAGVELNNSSVYPSLCAWVAHIDP